MARKNITIDDLARMVSRGFEGTAKKEQFEHLSGKIENLEKWAKMRFDNVDREIREVRKQLAGVVYRYEFDHLQDRVKDLENLLAVGSKKR